MRRHLHPILVLALTLTALAALGCGERDTPILIATGRPIINGEPDAVHPATVALTGGPGSGYFCSGSLITENVVLTAGHCVDGTNPSYIQVFFGDSVWGAGEYRPVREGEVHPNYDRDLILNDLALLQLANPAPADVTPVPHLPADLGLSAADEGVTTVDFSGFGATETGGSGVKLHVSDTIDVVCDGPGVCAGYVNPNAFGYDQQPGGPCSGDSGGPAYVVRDGTEYVAGATSYGDQNCAQFGVSTTVDRFAGWINSFITPEDCTNGLDDDDDGLTDCGDSECAQEPTCPDACELALIVGCQDQVSGTTDGGAWPFTQYGCLPDGFEIGPEVAYALDVPTGTQVTADLYPGAGGDLDFFAIRAGGGACDPLDCIGGSFEYMSPERIAFQMPAEPVYLLVETWDRPTTFDLQVTCGAAEDCTNQADDDGDGATDCDDTDCDLHPACRPDACEAAAMISCGETASGDTNEGVLRFASYGCISGWTEDGPEVAYRLSVPAGTPVTAVLQHGDGADLDLFALPPAGNSCDVGTCLAASMEAEPPEQVELIVPAEGALLVVETYQNPAPFDLTVTCGTPVELCDDGQDNDGDGAADCDDPDCDGVPACRPPAELSIDPQGFDVTASEDAPDPSLTLTVENAGGKPMSFTVTPSEAWITASPAWDVLGPGISRTVEVQVALAQLAVGLHQGELVIEAPDAVGSPATVALQVEVVAARPVPPVESLSLDPLDQALRLTWQKPDDPIVSGVLIRRAPDNPPASPDLGVLVYDGPDEELTDSGLQNGTRYCYSAFAHDVSARFADPATACVAPGENHAPPAPEHLSPGDGAVLPGAPELVATAVTDPEEDAVTHTFRLLDETGAALGSGAGAVSGDRVTWTPTVDLEPGSTYRWQVQAEDDRGAASGFSDPWSFTLRATTDGGTDGGQPKGDGQDGCGCAQTGSPATTGMILLALGLVVVRRRRPQVL